MSTAFDPHEVPTMRTASVVRGALLVALIGAAIVGLGVWLAPTRTLAAYLSAVISTATLVIGALVLLMIVHAMRARWPIAVRRLVEAVVHAWPVLALAFVPVLVLCARIYVWADPAQLDTHARALVQEKRAWLDVGAFAVRAAVIWAVVGGVAALLLRWSRRQDHVQRGGLRRKQRRLSAAALPAVALALTLAAFDWVMSLEPTWYSSIFGIDVFAGGFVGAIAIVTLLVALAHRRLARAHLLSASHYHALGRLLLAFVAFWAYIAFFQLLLVWIANKPDEVAWYLPRLGGDWRVVATLLGVGHFAVPFAVLLSYRLKRSRGGLATVATWLALMHLVDVQWKVVPAWRDAAVVHWSDLGALMLVIGAAVAWAAWRCDGLAIAPRFDALLAEGTRYESG